MSESDYKKYNVSLSQDETILKEKIDKVEITTLGCYHKGYLFVAFDFDFVMKEFGKLCKVIYKEIYLEQFDCDRNRWMLYGKSFQENDENSTSELILEFTIFKSSIVFTNIGIPNINYELNEKIAFFFDPDDFYNFTIDTKKQIDSHCFTSSSSNNQFSIRLRVSSSFESHPKPTFSNDDNDLEITSTQDLLYESLFCCSQASEHYSREFGTILDDIKNGHSARQITDPEHVSLILNGNYCCEQLLLENKLGSNYIYLKLIQRNFLTFYQNLKFEAKEFSNESNINISYESNLVFYREDLDKSSGIIDEIKKISYYRYSFDVDWWYFNFSFGDFIQEQDRFFEDLYENFHCFKNLFPFKPIDTLILPAFSFYSDRDELNIYEKGVNCNCCDCTEEKSKKITSHSEE